MITEQTWREVEALVNRGFHFFLNSHNIEAELEWESEFTRIKPEPPDRIVSWEYWEHYEMGVGQTPEEAVRKAVNNVHKSIGKVQT